MDNEHWFDTLNKSLIRATPRRTMLGVAATVVTSLVLGGLPLTDAAKNKKRNKKKKGKGKGRPRRCGPDIHASCDISFASPLGTPEDRQFCKDKCERCKQAGTAFCILSEDVVRATCCNFADECCGEAGVIGQCCTSDRCCAIDGSERCLDPGETCCPSDEDGYCGQGETCCPGQGCFSCDPPFVVNPVTCEYECLGGGCDGCDELCVGPALACCDGDCVNITVDEENCGGCGLTCIGDGFLLCCASRCVNGLTDPEHCGGCGKSCTGPGEQCCDGYCAETTFSRDHCGGCDRSCNEPGLQCCDGDCFDTRFDDDHCGPCRKCPADKPRCCHGDCYDPTNDVCCPDHPRFPYGACHRPRVCCTTAGGSPGCCLP